MTHFVGKLPPLNVIKAASALCFIFRMRKEVQTPHYTLQNLLVFAAAIRTIHASITRYAC